MKTELEANETLVKKGSANLQRGAETVGGNLYLTNRRLVFESHAFNLKKGVTTVSLSDVVETKLCWTKFLNLFPVFPNSLAVETTQGNEHRFVLFGRGSWKDEIESHRQSGGESTN